MKTLLLYLLIHIIARSFQLIWQKSKKEGIMSIIYPSIIYFALIFLPYLIMGFQLSMLITGIALGLSNAIIVLMGYYLKCQPGISEDEKNTRYLDLFCQLLSIFIVVLVIALFRSGYVYDKNAVSTFLLIDQYGFIRIIAALLLLWTPGSLVIKCLLKEKKNPEEGDRKHGGAIIGYVERVLLLTGFYLGLYVAAILLLVVKAILGIGLVWNNPEKSERMIIGTFMSLLYTIVVVLACFILI